MNTIKLNSDLLSIRFMTSEEAGQGGKHLSIAYSFGAATPLGEMLVASTSVGICYLAFVTDGRDAVLAELNQLFPQAAFLEKSDKLQERLWEVLGSLLTGEKAAEAKDRLLLHLKGTRFQQQVWQALLTIPWGGVRTYGEIAAQLGCPKACRAVGTAIGANPVSVLIPCHRVLRSDGTLGGYHWGTDRKARLLKMEAYL